MAAQKKLHPADVADIAACRAAPAFNVHLRISPAEKINRPAATLAEAIAIMDELNAAQPNRRALVYAIFATGASLAVPKPLIEETRRAGA